MKFCVPLLLLLLLLFDTLQGSTLPHVRKVRALNTTLQTNFNGTYERRNPCTNAEIESTSYIASHEFHHHTHEDNWSDYTHKCSAIISGFLQAIGNLVRFNNNQNGLFNFHINTSISQKQVGDHELEACCESMPTILIEATDCEVTPRTQKDEEKAVTEGKYDGPVCLLNKRNKPVPVTVPKTACNADKRNPPSITPNSEIPQNEYHGTEESLEELWNPIKTSFGETIEPSNVEYSQTVPNGVAERMKTTCEQTPPESKTPTALLPEPEPQVILDLTSYEASQPNFGLENSQGSQATAFENANEQSNFNPPAPIPNMPYSPQPSFNGIGIPPQSVVSVTSEELSIRNQFPPGPRNEQGLSAVYPQQPSNENMDRQIPGPLLRERLPDSYPNQMPVSLAPSQTEGNPEGGPDYPQNSPAFEPTYSGQNSNLGFSGNYPPTPEQAPPMRSSFELPPLESNNNPSEEGFTETQAPEQISDTEQTSENNFTPDQQQTVAREKVETVYYNDEPMNYNQVPTTPSPEIQPEFLTPESQQNLPYYPSEIARNEQPPVNSEVLPSVSVGPKDAVFSDSLIIPNGRVSAVANSLQPMVQLNSQPPVAPSLNTPQEKPFEEPSTIPPPVESTNNLVQYQQFGIPVYQIPPNSNQISNSPPINSFSNQLAPNNFVQPVPTIPSTVGNISLSNNFPEQSKNNFDTPQQPDSTVLIPSAQPIPILGPQPSQDFTGQLPENNMSGPAPQNFQNIAPVDVVPLQSSTVATPVSDIIQRTAVEGSQSDYPTEGPEPSVSELVPNNIGSQLREITTYDKPVLNSNAFQPETQSYFTEPSDRNLDYTPQTSYDSVPATYKSEPESQSGLISSVQNSPERPIAPESFPNTPLTPELPPSTPDDTKTQSDSEQTRAEFAPTPTYPEFVNPPRNDFQTVPPRFGPQFMPPEQTFAYNRDTVAAQQSNLTPGSSNPLNQLPMENNPVVPVQPQPQFFSNQNGDFQQPLPDTAPTSPASAQMVTQQGYETTGPKTNNFPNAVPQDQPIAPIYPQPPIQSGVPDYEAQPPNGPAFPQGKIFSQNEFYTQSPQNENQQFQATPQSVLPYHPPNVPVQSPESQEQLINAETTSAEFTPNPPAAPEASESFPKEYPSVEQQAPGFDGSQMSQQNYPNPGFQNRQPFPVDLPASQVTASQSFPGQSDSNLNYNGVQPNGIDQPQPRIPDQFSLQANPNLLPVTLPPQTGPMNTQNGVNPNELQTFAPSASFQQTGLAPSPLPPLQTVPENSQVNNFSQGSAFGSNVSPTTEISAEGVENLMLNPEQPSGVSQSEPQDLNTQDQFSPAVPPQFATQSSGEAITVKPNPYQTQPSEVYFDGVPGVQTTDQILTSIDEYHSPVTTVQEPLNYFQERPDDVAQTTPPPFQDDQFLTSQSQSEYVQNNAAMYSPNLPPRPQPQPSFDNLTEFPGDKTAGSTTQTPSPSEIKPETLGSQPPRQTALTQTNIPDTDSTKTPDTQSNSASSEYLAPQIYSNFDAPAPAVNYPGQDTGSFPPAADSITRDMTYQTINPAFTPSVPTVPTFGVNPMQMVFNSTSSYFSTPMTPSEGLETQPFRQASALIASPQPQSTTVKYNQQIIIPQNQIPTASNPQPQETLKYSDPQSGDNTERGLPDSVAWTSSGPQEAMGATPPLQYQAIPLGSQFPRSSTVSTDENKDFQLPQKELPPVIQSSLPPIPIFEQQGDNSQEKTTIAEETIATAMPKEWAYSSDEDQTAYSDKLLNNSTPIQQYDQTTGQKQTQQIYFSPTKTGEVATEYFVTPSPPFQQPLEIQNQPQIQSSSLTNSGENETGSPVSALSPFEQEIKVQSQPQLQPFTSTNMREVPTDSFVGPPSSTQPQIEDQSQPQLQSFSSTNIQEVIATTPVTPISPYPQQITVQPQTELQYPTTTMREEITASPVTTPPVIQQQIDVQPQLQLQSFSSNMEEIRTDSPVTPLSALSQQIQPQTQPQPFSSTISRETVNDSLVSQPPTSQPQTEDQSQPQLVQYDPTNIREDSTVLPVTAPPAFEQQIDVQPQTELQPFSSTITRGTATDFFVTQPPPFQPQTEDETELQLQSSASTYTRDGIADSPVTASPFYQQQTEDNPQTQLQSFSSTTSREVVPDSLVSPPPPVQQEIENQFQSQAEEFVSTNFRTEMAASSVTPPSLQPQTQVQHQKQFQIISSTNSREGITDSPVTSSTHFPGQTDDLQQTQLTPLSSTISREIVTNSLVRPPPPPPFQQQTYVDLPSQLQSFPSTIMKEIISDSAITPPHPFPQHTNVQPQNQPQPFSSTIFRETITDSFGSQPPMFQPQIQDQPKPKLEDLNSTNIGEDKATPLVTATPSFQEQIETQSQPQLQSFSSAISRETVTDSFVSQPPPFNPQIGDQPPPQVQTFPSTNMKYIRHDSPITPPLPFRQQTDVQSQTEPQPFSSTVSGETVTDSFVNPPLPIQPRIEDQPKPQPEEFYTTNTGGDKNGPLVTGTPPFQQQIQIQSEIQPQSFSSTISGEAVTDSSVSQSPSFQSQIDVQSQTQPEEFRTTNISEDTTTPSAIPPPTLPQQIQVQPQTHRQQFYSTISRETVTDTFVSPPPSFQPQTEDQPEPKLEEFYTTNIREDTTTPSVAPPPQFQQQAEVQPQIELQYPTTIMQEDITVSPITSPPLLQQQTYVEPPPQLQSFPSSNMGEIRTDPIVSSTPPVQQQMVFQPQPQLQSFPSTKTTELTTDSLVPIPPFEQKIVVRTQPKLDSTNTMEVVTVSPFISPSPFEQEIEVQPQTQSQSFSSTITRETITDSLVSQPPPLQPQTEDQPQPQLEDLNSTNVAEDKAMPSVTATPAFQQQVQIQPELQPFSSTNTREVPTDSFVGPPSSTQPQIEDQPQPRVQSLPSTNMGETRDDSSVIPRLPLRQQINVQPHTQPEPFSSTASRETLTNSFVSQPPTFQPYVEDRSQPQLVQLDATNIREDSIVPPVTAPPSFQQQIEIQSQPQLQSFSSTNIQEVIATTPVTPISPYPQQITVQPQTELQYPTTTMREEITASPVTTSPVIQQQIDVQPQLQLQSFSSNMEEIRTDSPVTPLSALSQQIQPQTQPQPFSSTISRETVTDSLVSQPPTSQPQTEDQSQPQLVQYDPTNIREDSTVLPVTAPPSFQQQIEIQSQPQLQSFSSTNIQEVIATTPVTPISPYPQQITVQPQTELQYPTTIMREEITASPVTTPLVMQHQIDVQLQPQPQSFSSTISRKTVTDSLVSQPPPIESEVQSEPQLPAFSSPNAGDIMTDSPVNQSPHVQELLENQSQSQIFASRNPGKIMADSLVNPPPSFPQTEVQPKPELKSFSSIAHLQQNVEAQSQRDQQNFSLRNSTDAVSDSQESASASLQGARGQVQEQVAGNSTEAAADSHVNSAAKLEKHAAQEYQTQRVRYTTTSTKEVITESFLPTTESIYAETGKDGQWKSIEVRSDSEGNSSQGKKTTEVVEEILATDFPPVTKFSSLEDEFILADKLLNDSTPVLETTSFITVSPLGESTVEKVVTTAVETQKPVDQISINTTSENPLPLSKKSARVNYDQILPTQAPRSSDQVVASNPNNQTTSPGADRQSTFKSDLRPTYGTRYTKFGSANKPAILSPLRSFQTTSPNFQNSTRRVLFKATTAPDRQVSPYLNPLFQTLETHMTFPLQEPPGLSSLKFGPRRTYPLPRRSQSYLPSGPTFPSQTRKSGAYLVKFQNSENAAQETKSDPPVPVSNTTDPSNGPGSLKGFKNSFADKMAPASSSKN